MIGYQEIVGGNMAYDPEKDGVWLSDEDGDPTVFLPRNIIIQMLSVLANGSSPNRDSHE